MTTKMLNYIFIGLFTALVTTTVQAGFIYPNSDNRFLFDEDTGLKWLSFNYTQSLSFDSIYRYLTTGDTGNSWQPTYPFLDGYRLATAEEVKTLVNNAVGGRTPFRVAPTGYDNYLFYPSSALDSITRALTCTYVNYVTFGSTCSDKLVGFVDGVYYDGGGLIGTRAEVVIMQSYSSNYYDYVQFNSIDVASRNSYPSNEVYSRGTFLVQDTRALAVNEPASYLILLTALLFFIRKLIPYSHKRGFKAQH